MDFHKRVMLVCNHIPYGKVSTYGQIAALCGLPGNSRQVGYCLNHSNGENVPAHRMVNSQGILSGADSFETSDTQMLRLEAEGIVMENPRKVDLKEYGWEPTWDETVAFEYLFEAHGI